MRLTKLNIAGWSSSVARRAHNPKVVGSNPAPAITQSTENILFSVLFFLYKIKINRRENLMYKILIAEDDILIRTEPHELLKMQYMVDSKVDSDAIDTIQTVHCTNMTRNRRLYKVLYTTRRLVKF